MIRPDLEDSDGRHAVSYYKFRCECGEKVITESSECQCSECGRLIRIEWRAVYQSPAPARAAAVLPPWVPDGRPPVQNL